MAFGDIGAIIDTLNFDGADGFEPSLIHVSGNIYAIAYRGPGNDGWLKTVSIAAAGDIGDSVIDSFEFEATLCYKPCIIHVTGNIYAIVYNGVDADGFIKTVSIAVDGNIGGSVLDTLEFDAQGGYSPRIIHVSGTIYAIAYMGYYSDGLLVTLSIAADGNIGASVIDTLEFDGAKGDLPHIIHVAGNVFAIAYTGADNDGWIKTVTIATNGQIDDTPIDSLEFDGVLAVDSRLINVFEHIFAVAYGGDGSDGWLKTFSIAETGAIGGATIDSFEFDVTTGLNPYIFHVSGSIFGIAYKDSASDGWLKTLSIAADGEIAEPIIDSFEFDNLVGQSPSVLYISGDVYAIAYTSNLDVGKLITLDISTEPPGGIKHFLTMGIG